MPIRLGSPSCIDVVRVQTERDVQGDCYHYSPRRSGPRDRLVTVQWAAVLKGTETQSERGESLALQDPQSGPEPKGLSKGLFKGAWFLVHGGHEALRDALPESCEAIGLQLQCGLPCPIRGVHHYLVHAITVRLE